MIFCQHLTGLCISLTTLPSRGTSSIGACKLPAHVKGMLVIMVGLEAILYHVMASLSKLNCALTRLFYFLVTSCSTCSYGQHCISPSNHYGSLSETFKRPGWF